MNESVFNSQDEVLNGSFNPDFHEDEDERLMRNARCRTTQTTEQKSNTAYRIPPQAPLAEDYSQLRIDSCVTSIEVPTIPHGQHHPTKTTLIDVMKAQNSVRAYVKLDFKKSKCLDHHGPGWGCVFFGVILYRDGNAFREPSPDGVEYVAIKKLRLSVVRNALRQGKRENPYKEVLRMQTLGDDIHVLSCIEALQDDRHLYIVMPYCEQESLVESIPWHSDDGGLSEQQARVYFCQILENMVYLHNHGICHRDLSPDNCMIHKGRIVFTDLAMSFRVPIDSSFMSPLGGFGKPAYLPPEVFLNLPFDAFDCDLYSSAIILFNLLIGEVLFEIPLPSNLLFKYFILGKGISTEPANECTAEILSEVGKRDRASLLDTAEKVMRLTPQAQDLLERMLQVKRGSRLTLDQVRSHPWVKMSTR